MLKPSNLRMTPQRQVILEELRSVTSHPSADEIYELVRKRMPRISLGTVYRNLDILAKCGEIQKLELGCSMKRFDGVAEEHYHIRCLYCDRVFDVPPHSRIYITHQLEGCADFKIIGHRFEFIGICPACREQPPS